MLSMRKEPKAVAARGGRGVFARAADLLRDNPVLDKDAATTLRSTATTVVVAVVGLAAWGLTAFVHVVQEPGATDLLTWRGLEPSGRSMFVAVCGALLFVTTLFMPAAASSAIAAERERGTLPLLLVSALSPARIVAGKLVALLLVAAPLFCIALPLLGLASIYGGVGALDVVVALALAAFHAVCVAAAGIGASALVGRARLAAPLAMLFSAVPALSFGLPLIGALAVYAAGDDLLVVGPLLVVGGATSLAFAVGSLLLARDRLSPASAPRWPLRRIVVGLVLVGLQPLAAVAVRLFQTGGHDRDEVAGVAIVAAALVVGFTAVLEVCLADVRAVDRGSPRARALLVAGLGAVGFALAAAVPLSATPSSNLPWLGGPAWQTAPIAVPIAALYLAFCAQAAAVVARVVRGPALRVALVGFGLGALFVVPLVLHELRWALGLERYPLGFTNPLLVVDSLTFTRGDISLLAVLVFFGVAAMVMAALAKGRRPV